MKTEQSMKTVSKLALAIAIIAPLAPSFGVAAEGCDAYPLSDGMSAEVTDRGPKIVSTASIAVNIDDQSEVLDAMKEAEMAAKAQISKFFNETISSDESVDKAVETQVKIVGDQKSTTRTELKKQLSSMRNSSQSLIKGSVKIGDCYTKGKFVRVSIGIKPETAAAAASGQQMMQGSSSAKPNTSQSAPSGGKPNGVDGFSNTSNISKF